MIYLDYNATTPLCDAAREAMLPYLARYFGNPSSVHTAGREARAAIDNARDKLAALLHTKPNEIIFTSGGTESCNLAVLGLARRHRHSADGTSPGLQLVGAYGSERRRCHVISCKAEHHAVLNAVEHLEKREGFDVTWLDVSENGLVDLDQLDESIRPETRLVSIMTANNETGVVQPIREISGICRRHGVPLHSDMVQSFGKISGIAFSPSPLPARKASRPEGKLLRAGDQAMSDRQDADATLDLSLVDAASFAAHKFYGPKGAGFLFLKSGLSIQPVLFGGAHENGRRPGTENVAAIAGMAAAAESALRDREIEQNREAQLRDKLWAGIATSFSAVRQNGDIARRLANTLNVSFPGIDSETMLMALDLEGVCASSGSACMVGSVVASHVLLAMGLPMERASSAVRFSLGQRTTPEEIDRANEAIRRIRDRLEKTTSGEYVVA